MDLVNMSKQEPFTKNLKQLMREKNLSVRKIAEITGAAKSTVHSWLMGSKPTNYEMLLTLSDHFGVSLAWLLTGRNEKQDNIKEFIGHKEEGVIFDGIAMVTVKKICFGEKMEGNLSDEKSNGR